MRITGDVTSFRGFFLFTVYTIKKNLKEINSTNRYVKLNIRKKKRNIETEIKFCRVGGNFAIEAKGGSVDNR